GGCECGMVAMRASAVMAVMVAIVVVALMVALVVPAVVLWALLLGFVVFGDFPAPLTLLGAAIVVGSGLYSFYRELQVTRRAAVPSTRP
ncbi:MAG: EamA/RhaT family transporter, partial [Pseudooceanicola atlanticus]